MQTMFEQASANPMSLNGNELVLWFDDLGSGNPTYNFLSNFHQAEKPLTFFGLSWDLILDDQGNPVRPDNGTALVEFITGEHAFAAMKFLGSDSEHFANIVEAREVVFRDKRGNPETFSAPNYAKMLGRSRKHPLRSDWEAVKMDVMAAITREKYTLETAEGLRLLKTGDALLVEGTHWGDEVWGVDLDNQEVHLPGRNWLGTLLMVRRAELRAMQAFGMDNDIVRAVVGNTGFYNAEFSTQILASIEG